MSYTGIYSTIYSMTGKEGVIIKDLKGFREWLEEMDFAMYDWFSRAYLLGSGYPRADVNIDVGDDIKVRLLGFRSRGEGNYYNIERVAYNYNSDDFIDFWSEVGKYVEDFWFLHSLEDGYVPDLFDLYLGSCDYCKIVMVEVKGGEVYIHEIGAKVVEDEKG